MVRPVGLTILWLIVMIGMSIGCGSVERSDGDVYDHEEIPAHKPRHYVEAVGTLEALVNGPDLADSEMMVLADLIGWLPELAAESDLTEESWLEIASTAHEAELLLSLYDKGPQALSERSADAVTNLDRQAWRGLIQRLQRWCVEPSLSEPIYDGRDSSQE